jgi:hypothetical protein
MLQLALRFRLGCLKARKDLAQGVVIELLCHAAPFADQTWGAQMKNAPLV